MQLRSFRNLSAQAKRLLAGSQPGQQRHCGSPTFFPPRPCLLRSSGHNFTVAVGSIVSPGVGRVCIDSVFAAVGSSFHFAAALGLEVWRGPFSHFLCGCSGWPKSCACWLMSTALKSLYCSSVLPLIPVWNPSPSSRRTDFRYPLD